ncbi:MAG TPA: hypothetical protein VHW71_08930 [Steroidobacteraceae bacterium]|nr:hypothetical protein [Steroidobacteraceae bacterium]
MDGQLGAAAEYRPNSTHWENLSQASPALQRALCPHPSQGPGPTSMGGSQSTAMGSDPPLSMFNVPAV